MLILKINIPTYQIAGYWPLWKSTKCWIDGQEWQSRWNGSGRRSGVRWCHEASGNVLGYPNFPTYYKYKKWFLFRSKWMKTEKLLMLNSKLLDVALQLLQVLSPPNGSKEKRYFTLSLSFSWPAKLPFSFHGLKWSYAHEQARKQTVKGQDFTLKLGQHRPFQRKLINLAAF